VFVLVESFSNENDNDVLIGKERIKRLFNYTKNHKEVLEVIILQFSCRKEDETMIHGYKKIQGFGFDSSL